MYFSFWAKAPMELSGQGPGMLVPTLLELGTEAGLASLRETVEARLSER